MQRKRHLQRLSAALLFSFTPDFLIHYDTMPVSTGTPQTLYDKVFSSHIVDEKLDGTILLYIGSSRRAAAAAAAFCEALS